MLSENSEVFTKENLNRYLNELSKEYKKLGGRNVPVEIILIGGAAVIENYGFREMTTDIDAILPAMGIMKDAINHVGDRFHLPDGWLNADFTMTGSYSPQITAYSVPYRTFNQVLHVRVVTGAYLIAMKLRAGRKYKNDLSDIVGILSEQEASGNPITYEQIDTAVQNLYGGWEKFATDSVSFIRDILDSGNYNTIYDAIRSGEVEAKKALLTFQEKYPNVLSDENVDRVLERTTQSKQSVLEQLQKRKRQDERGER